MVDVVPFGGHDAENMLRLAACLEEHYPHSMANAVVEEAKRRGLSHAEYHSCVEYVVAHGISSAVNGQKVVIGSAHFVFEDEGCVIPEGEKEKFDALPPQYSHLYLCISGTLAAVICIFDPLREDAAGAIDALHDCGICQVVMMTGDNVKTAQSIARAVGVDDFHAEVLPEDKAAYIQKARAAGHTVMMVGDGVNDSPALSEADVGISVSTGAAIAREIADVTISSEYLYEIVTFRQLPLHRRLQPAAHRFGRVRRDRPDHLGNAPQRVHARNRVEEHDESAAGGHGAGGIILQKNTAVFSGTTGEIQRYFFVKDVPYRANIWFSAQAQSYIAFPAFCRRMSFCSTSATVSGFPASTGHG